MTDQLALGLLAQLVDRMQEQINLLAEKVENLEALISESDEGVYLDGSK